MEFYKSCDYDNRANIHPAIFGKVFWPFLYYTAWSYPKENPSHCLQEKFRELFENLKYYLPCEKCRAHFMQNVQKNPVKNHLKNRETLLRWIVNLESTINKSLGKSPVYYNQVYEKLNLETNIQSKNMEVIKPIVIIGLIAGGYYLYKKYNK